MLHVCETRRFVMAILNWKQWLLCDKIVFLPTPLGKTYQEHTVQR